MPILMKMRESFWRTIPRKSLLAFFLGVFLIFSTIGFANDVMSLGRIPAPRFFSVVFFSGAFAVAYALSGIRLRSHFWKATVPIFVVQFGLMSLIGNLFPDLPQPTTMSAADIARLQTRLIFDGGFVIFTICLAYVCFIYVTVAEGRRYAHAHAEMVLATQIHRVLVPAIDNHVAGFEFYGRSFPSGEVGGDLIDVFQHGRGWIAYIADVSGHGVAPGVLMGMVKSAARMQLSSPERSAALLGRLNAVLHPIKKPEMFVTFAYLAWNGERLEYSVAGHPPILHFHTATKQVTELTCSNLPVAMFQGREFASQFVECAPNDLFLLFTDGIIEVTNAKDEEFGLPAIKSILSAHGDGPLEATLQALIDANTRHGRADDDRSLLLVRKLRPA